MAAGKTRRAAATPMEPASTDYVEEEHAENGAGLNPEELQEEYETEEEVPNIGEMLARMKALEREGVRQEALIQSLMKEKEQWNAQNRQQSSRGEEKEQGARTGEASSSKLLPRNQTWDEERTAGVKRSRGEEVKGGYRGQVPNERRRRQLQQLTRSPFTAEVLSFAMPTKVRDLPSYNGTSDPMTHIYQLQNKTGLGPEDGMALCRLFPSTLIDGASVWFRTLEPGSIGNFDELYEVFTSQYMCNIPMKKQVNELFAFKQHKGEKIRDYVKRFFNLHAQVEGCSSAIAAMAFRAGLLEGTKFHLSLHAKPRPTLKRSMNGRNLP